MIKIKKEYKDLKDVSGFCYEISGIRKGFGNTIGNSIRRAIISNTPGLAIYGYSLSCFSHEFDKNSAIVEDAGEIMYRLKSVSVEYSEEVSSEVVSVDIQGPIQFTAGMLETEVIKIVNKDYVLFNVSKKTKLTLKVYINKGVGFVTHQENAKKIASNEIISCTSFYSRVERVSYKVEIDEVSEDRGEIVFLSIDASKCYSEDFILKSAFQRVIDEFTQVAESIDREEEVENTEAKKVIEKLNALISEIVSEAELAEKIISLNSQTLEELVGRLGDAKVQKQLGVKKAQIKEILSKIKEKEEATDEA